MTNNENHNNDNGNNDNDNNNDNNNSNDDNPRLRAAYLQLLGLPSSLFARCLIVVTWFSLQLICVYIYMYTTRCCFVYY